MKTSKCYINATLLERLTTAAYQHFVRAKARSVVECLPILHKQISHTVFQTDGCLKLKKLSEYQKTPRLVKTCYTLAPKCRKQTNENIPKRNNKNPKKVFVKTAPENS